MGKKLWDMGKIRGQSYGIWVKSYGIWVKSGVKAMAYG